MDEIDLFILETRDRGHKTSDSERIKELLNGIKDLSIKNQDSYKFVFDGKNESLFQPPIDIPNLSDQKQVSFVIETIWNFLKGKYSDLFDVVNKDDIPDVIYMSLFEPNHDLMNDANI